MRLLKKVLRKIIGPHPPRNDIGKLSLEVQQLIRDIRGKNLTYLPEGRLASIALTCMEVRDRGVPGAFLEAGCALGGSTVLIGRLKEQSRPLMVYDVFGMIPPPTADDPERVHARYAEIAEGKSDGLNGDQYYGYMDNLQDVVTQNLRAFGVELAADNVSLIKGLLQDTMTIEGPVAFAHIDVDWFDPVLVCLQRIFPKLSVGGSIILDDYNDWGGCKKATDQYLATVKGQYRVNDRAGSRKITRTR